MTAAREDNKLDAPVMRAVEPRRFPTWHDGYARRLVFADSIAVVAAVGLAQWIRFGTLPVTTGSTYAPDYAPVSVAITVAWLAALHANRSRSVRIIGAGTEEYRRVWTATLAVFGGVAIVSMLLKLEIARGYLLVALPAGIIILSVLRWSVRRLIVQARMKYGHYITRVVAVGSVAAVRDLTQSLAREKWSEYQVVGACIAGPIINDRVEVPGVRSVQVFGSEADVVEAVLATECHAVAVTASDRMHSRAIRDLSWELEKLDVDLLVAPGVVDIAGPRLQMRPVAGLPLINVEKPQYNGAKRFQKRLFDVTFSSAVLLCGLLLLLFIASAIKLTSPGPIFYRSVRIGLNGEPFEMLKFRTMVDGADKMLDKIAHQNDFEGGVLFKLRHDPRVTPVGRFLRKYSLDELPQFINVFKRDMSVVGPRPPLANEVGSYDDYAKRRLLVRPGITGLWQVSGRSDLSWEDSVRLDLFYVENWSMVSDLLIAIKTVKAILSHNGAY